MLIQQDKSADTVVVFRGMSRDGFCSELCRMLYFFALCQRKGYYFIVDAKSFSVISYTDVFKPFWSEETNRSMLESAKQIHQLGEGRYGQYPVRNDARIFKYKSNELSMWLRAINQKPWEKYSDRNQEAGRSYQRLVKLGAKNNLFAEGDIAHSWDDHIPTGLLKKIYQLQDDVREQVDSLKQAANLPEVYQAIQVRQKREYVKLIYYTFFKQPPPLTEYLSKLDSDIRDVYVATDTEDVFKEFRRGGTSAYQYHSLIQENKKPHIASDAKSGQERIQSAVCLLADLELCVQARKFVGNDYSAVSDTILYLRRDLGKEINHPAKWGRATCTWCIIICLKLKIWLKRVLKKLNLMKVMRL